MVIRFLLLGLLGGAAVLFLVAGLAIVLGGPADPPPSPEVNDPFRAVDFSDLPAPGFYQARDGAALAYRVYPAQGGTSHGSVVLVHGSSASGASLHPLAKRLAEAGCTAYALDMRGHGGSGSKGRIAYVGQLEDDLEDFLGAVQHAQPTLLAGFSSGGGFALRFAGSARQRLFSGYLLLAPFLGSDAPTQRPDNGGWVRVGVPRLVAILLLDALGVRAFNGLPVLSFALDEKSRELLTPRYSYALAANFQPRRDWRGNLRAVASPLRVLAGTADEAFHGERFPEVIHSARPDLPVRVLPGVGHLGLTLEPAGIAAVVEEAGRLAGR
jgi:pimeloyl-ACP methyl ester carboxylesterase